MILLNVSLLDVRIVFLFTAFVHIIVTAIVTLSIDTTVDDDPEVRAYHYIRWKLITCWFNLVMLAYLPLRLFVDWQIRRGAECTAVKQLQQVSDVVMTAILFPVVMFADISFWVIYYKLDVALLAPPRVLAYLPTWAQHSLHSVSCAVVAMDLLLTPRSRPASLKPRIALLLAFSFTYFFVVLISYLQGEMIYRVFADINVFQITLIFSVSLSMVMIFFSLQWIVIDLMWRSKPSLKKLS